MESLSSPSAGDQRTTEETNLQALAQRTLNPPLVDDLHTGDSATVSAQFWLDRLPLRITAGWSVLAALLAAGLLWRPLDITWSNLVLLWRWSIRSGERFGDWRPAAPSCWFCVNGPTARRLVALYAAGVSGSAALWRWRPNFAAPNLSHCPAQRRHRLAGRLRRRLACIGRDRFL